MPANTPILALPYPVPADTVDVPRDMLALATKLDGITKPLLVTALPGSGVTGDEIYYAPASGGFWHMRYDATIGDSSKWVNIGGNELASGYGAGPTTAKTADAATFALDATGPALALPAKGIYIASSCAVILDPVVAGVSVARLRIQDIANPANFTIAATYVPSNANLATSVTIKGTMAVGAATSLRFAWATNNLDFRFGADGRMLFATPLRLG